MGTASLTRSVKGLLAATVSFFPPLKANTVAPTVNSVPSVRYSFLMLRPKMTLSTGWSVNVARRATRRRKHTKTWRGRTERMNTLNYAESQESSSSRKRPRDPSTQTTPPRATPTSSSSMAMNRRVSKLSAVHRGTAFEMRCLHLLQAHFSMALRRVGGRSDGGIDLVGSWWLPFATESDHIYRPSALPDMNGLLRRRLRVLAQCKAEKKKFSPKYVREMEGVWHLQSGSSPSLTIHSPPPLPPPSMAYELTAPNVYPTVALLLSESPFSQSTLLHAYRSTVPFLLIHFPVSESSATLTSASDTEVASVYPNPTLTHLVKPLAFCWERNPSVGSPTETDASIVGRPGLWWQGHKLGSWAPDLPDLDAA